MIMSLIVNVLRMINIIMPLIVNVVKNINMIISLILNVVRIGNQYPNTYNETNCEFGQNVGDSECGQNKKHKPSIIAF